MGILKSFFSKNTKKMKNFKNHTYGDFEFIFPKNIKKNDTQKVITPLFSDIQDETCELCAFWHFLRNTCDSYFWL